jgi:catalase
VTTSPDEALEVIHRRFGAHDGHRALHAKGVLCRGTFTPTPEAAKLTRAAHMQAAVPTTVRFSNGGGDPNVPDYAPEVRGLALTFHLPDGSRTDILSQTVPYFVFHDQEGFLDLLRADAARAGKVSPGALLRIPLMAIRNPRLVRNLPQNLKAMTSLPASFASRSYFPFHAYRWLDADGGERWVRYTWRPTIDEANISRSKAKRRGADYLFDELRERLGREPVRMELEVQIAGEGDDPHDPSSQWPSERERVIVGTLEVTAIDPDADDGIVFDPMRLTDGIEPSDDPVLRYRPAVYTLSHERRTAS